LGLPSALGAAGVSVTHQCAGHFSMSPVPAIAPTPPRDRTMDPKPSGHFARLQIPAAKRAALTKLGRRLLHFWILWTVLLLIHEGGHAWMAHRDGLVAERVTVGVGPVVWRSARVEPEVVLRLVPVAGITRLGDSRAGEHHDATLVGELSMLLGGSLATLGAIVATVVIVASCERCARRRCRWGRVVIADALVLTLFNFLPLPPLDGGRAALSILVAWRGAPFSSDALFWLHLGGLAVAVVPMLLWTGWTARLDALALQWRAPRDGSRRR
jgi:Zn-dependent protease